MFPPGRGSRDTKGNLVQEGKAEMLGKWDPSVLVFRPGPEAHPISNTPPSHPAFVLLLID